MQLSKFEKNNLILAMKSCQKIWQESEKQKSSQLTLPAILLVEDCSVQLKMFGKIIENCLENFDLPNCQIHKSQSGELAKILAAFEYSKSNLKLIILDLTLSDMSGVDLLPKLPQDIPVLCVSASNEPFIAEKINGFPNVFKFIKKGSKLSNRDWAEIKQIMKKVFQDLK